MSSKKKKKPTKKQALIKKEQALIVKIQELFADKKDITIKRSKKEEFGASNSIWELRVNFAGFSQIPFFVIASSSYEDSFIRIYLKVRFAHFSFSKGSPIQHILITEASKHSLFCILIPRSKEEKDLINGFVLELPLQKKFVTEKGLIDACLQMTFGFNSLVNTIELSSGLSQKTSEEKDGKDDLNDILYFS